MMVEILTFGDELLDGRRIDSNSAWLGRRLTALGIPPRFHQTTADRMDEVIQAFHHALSRADVVITTGGLGPTADDLTFEALSRALDRPLVFHPDIFEKIKRRFEARKLVFPLSNRRQALLPKGSVELPNDWGTAPGLRLEHQGKLIYCLPGVPSEMKNIFEKSILLELEARTQKNLRRTEKIYSFVGIGESLLEEAIDRCKLHEIADSEIRVAYTASFPQVDVTLSVLSNTQDSLNLALSEAQKRMLDELGSYLVSEGGISIESRIISEFKRHEWTLSVAESFTGGLLSSKIIDVPGSSDVFERGWVTYSNRSKIDLLGVHSETLETYGAVSKECAMEMARGAKSMSGSTIAVATTGIAGPSGATSKKPVGLSYIAVIGPNIEESNLKVGEFQFQWDRNRNRTIAVYEALKMLIGVVSPVKGMTVF
ncbi:MAG: CinA family nicotinamide mononucleotide deamidase-related protein [Bdellovibrionales bacterium]|nr:CinA family nicotinamide mononucleotide deamidase-related protein [Bdellovibrionales bacterium]